MLLIWPKESDLAAFDQEQLEEGEVWDKGEAYMKILIKLDSCYDRLFVWSFKCKWEEESEICNNFYKNIINAYNQIQTNDIFISVVSYTLGIGNVLNGGTPKGQADGFDLPVLGKLVSMKDNTN
jgi:hypothetical protein